MSKDAREKQWWVFSAEELSAEFDKIKYVYGLGLKALRKEKRDEKKSRNVRRGRRAG